MTPSAPTPIRPARRARLAKGLAALWLLDALLKLQPSMFTPELIVNVLGPSAADNQPQWLYRLIIQSATRWYHLLPWSAIGIVAIEGFIAWAAWRGPAHRWGRRGLWFSLAWGLVVWTVAEGLGGLLTGSPSLMNGSPGSIPFYMAGTLLLLLPDHVWQNPAFFVRLRQGLGVFFVLAALAQALPGFWTPVGLGGVFGDVTMNGSEPVVMQQLINALVILAMHAPVLLNGIFVTITAAIGIALLRGRLGPLFIYGTALWLLFIWVAPQALGGLLTGSGTDPGTEFPLALLISLVLPPRERQTPTCRTL
ncbi:MAG: hypothetical protein M0Z53_02840 [Thermaerobacter sp.]|nr:hypothetical protein [Thermaerobacter sp.]